MRSDLKRDVACDVAQLSRRYPSYNLFGAKVTPTTADDLLAIVATYVGVKRQCIIASQNMHGIKVMLDDPEFRELHALPETYVHIDGMPLVGLCRLVGVAASPKQRVTLVDLIWPLLSLAAAAGWRVYFVGSTPGDLIRGLDEIRRRLPELRIGGIAFGYNGSSDPEDPSASARVVRALQEFGPDLVLVGMGMGAQERWILRNREAIAPACACTVGACMMYLCGSAATPPRWMGRMGLEWLFRLAGNPRRLSYRYLVEPWFVLGHIGKQLIRGGR